MDNLYNSKENKLVGQGLADIKTKRNSHIVYNANWLPMFSALISFATHS